MKKDAYKDIEKYKEAKHRQRKRYYENRGLNKYPTREWTSHEISLVLSRRMSDTELSKLIERSVSAIQAKRARLKS